VKCSSTEEAVANDDRIPGYVDPVRRVNGRLGARMVPHAVPTGKAVVWQFGGERAQRALSQIISAQLRRYAIAHRHNPL